MEKHQININQEKDGEAEFIVSDKTIQCKK